MQLIWAALDVGVLVFFPVPEARTLLLFLLWLFVKSFPALDPVAAFPGLGRVCEEISAGEVARVGLLPSWLPPA